MLDYRLRLRLESPTGTPWQSDTLFGHLVWMAALGGCDLPVDEFLAPFLSGKPPFILSDGFPAGLLPRPMVREAAAAPDTAAEYTLQKKRKKSFWVTAADFERIRAGGTAADPPPEKPWTSVETAHAALDRRTLRTGGEDSAGALFALESTTLTGKESDLDIYLRAADQCWTEHAINLMRKLSASGGYGRDRSIGMGAFTVAEAAQHNSFDPFEGADGFISLSSFCPADGDPTDGFWRTRVKHGRIGETVAPRENPFKNPFIQFEPGAFFHTGALPRPWYGRLIRGLSRAVPEAVQACFTIAVPARRSQSAKGLHL